MPMGHGLPCGVLWPPYIHLSPTTRIAAEIALRKAFRADRFKKYTVMRRVYFLLKI